MDTPNDGPWKRYLPLNMAIVGIDMLDFWDVSIRTWTWSLIHLFFWNCLIDLRTCAIQKLIAWLLNNLQRHSITYLTTSLISSINGSTILQVCANTLSRTDWMSCLWVVGQHTPRESHGSSSSDGGMTLGSRTWRRLGEPVRLDWLDNSSDSSGGMAGEFNSRIVWPNSSGTRISSRVEVHFIPSASLIHRPLLDASIRSLSLPATWALYSHQAGPSLRGASVVIRPGRPITAPITICDIDRLKTHHCEYTPLLSHKILVGS